MADRVLWDEEKIKEMFDLFDADGGGSIDVAELTAAFVKLGISDTQEEIDRLVAEIDADGSGEIEFDEFVEVMRQLQDQRDSAAEMSKAFYYFSDGKESITVADLRKAASDVGDDQPESFLQQLLLVADRDNDGVIKFSDFRAMMEQAMEFEQTGIDHPRKVFEEANIRDGVSL